MNFYANTGTQQLTQQPLVSSPIAQPVIIPRGNGVPFNLQFVNNGAIFDPTQIVSSIVSASVATASVITTSTPHGLSTGDSVVLSGITGATPSSINGTFQATVISATTFSVPVTVTVAGTGGTCTGTVPINLRCTIKNKNQFDQDPPAAFFNSFTQYGSGTSAMFSGSVNLITPQINQDLGIVTPITLGATISENNPGVVTTSAQTFSVGDTIVFETTGTLPAPLQPGIEYFITATTLTTTTFTVAATLGGTPIATTTAGSGTHTIIWTSETTVQPSASYMMEFSWDGANPSKTQWVNIQVNNDLYHPGDGTPVSTGGCQGVTPLVEGNSYANITFPFTLGGVNYHFTYLYIQNTTDPTPLVILVGPVTLQQQIRAYVQLSAAPDSSNYYLYWGVSF